MSCEEFCKLYCHCEKHEKKDATAAVDAQQDEEAKAAEDAQRDVGTDANAEQGASRGTFGRLLDAARGPSVGDGRAANSAVALSDIEDGASIDPRQELSNLEEANRTTSSDRNALYKGQEEPATSADATASLLPVEPLGTFDNPVVSPPSSPLPVESAFVTEPPAPSSSSPVTFVGLDAVQMPPHSPSHRVYVPDDSEKLRYADSLEQPSDDGHE